MHWGDWVAKTKRTKKDGSKKKSSPQAQLLHGLSDVEMKLLRLALDKGAYEGESDTAAVMFVRKLRERGVRADELFGNASSTAVTEYGNVKMTFGKYKNEMLKDIPISYLVWAFNNCVNMNAALRTAISKFLEEIGV